VRGENAACTFGKQSAGCFPYPKIENKLMESFRKIIQHLKNRLYSNTVFHRVLIFAVAAILGLFAGGNIIFG